jgi:glutamate N-acetyltransferase/amino-acid N-acetyltransferase
VQAGRGIGRCQCMSFVVSSHRFCFVSSLTSSPLLSGISSASSPAFVEFQRQLTDFCIDLAQMIVQDGEGVTKFVEVRVTGGRSYGECKIIANSVATSMLVKSALFGQDANWGRILAAVGYAGVPIDTNKVNLYIRPSSRQIVAPHVDATAAAASAASAAALGSLHLVKAGQPFDCNESHATTLFQQAAIVLHLDLGLGQEEATVWTCDLSIDYVKINADYRS